MNYYEYGNYYNDITNSGSDEKIVVIILAVLGFLLLILLLISVFVSIYNWKLYKKAGRQGWESIIPIYNIIVKFQFLNIPMWVLILLIIPGANVAVPIITAINTAKKFGKDGGFTIGLIFLPIIFYPILAFGKSEFDSSIKGIFEDGISDDINSNTRYCSNCGKPVTGKYCANCGSQTNL